ncbi:hypothetical protein JKP88DRAFT_251989 [Tribonema minus]|uniref:Uncharacterized protein n=1 Tax=Tribonema minus TaxID=303371 RepID=A0A835ZHM8_9STRA|nr:hypothetical protein JKP88DRAFT_251989 [Tribonema minus]
MKLSQWQVITVLSAVLTSLPRGESANQPKRAPHRILAPAEVVNGKTLSEYGSEFWSYVARTNENKLSLRLTTAIAQKRIDEGQPKPLLLLGATVCTGQEAIDHPLVCTGQKQPQKPIVRKATISLKKFKYLYIPIINYAGVADAVGCKDEGLSLKECKKLIKDSCFNDELDSGGAVAIFQAALDASTLESTLNKRSIAQSKFTLTTDEYQVSYIAPHVTPTVYPPGEPHGKIKPPFYGCSAAVAYMVEIEGPGTIEVGIHGIIEGFEAGPVTYKLTFVE